jgi:hypothetical protein
LAGGLRRTTATWISLCAALVLLACLQGCAREKESQKAPALGKTGWSEALPTTRVLLLFFPEAHGGSLRAEARRFVVGRGISGLMKSALVELGSGPRTEDLVSPFRQEIAVRGLYSQEDGTLFIDLGAGAQDVFGRGYSEEVAAIASITNTIFYNFPRVTRIRLLIDGEPVSSLGGHIDLSGFLYPEEWLQSAQVAL